MSTMSEESYVSQPKKSKKHKQTVGSQVCVVSKNLLPLLNVVHVQSLLESAFLILVFFILKQVPIKCLLESKS